MFALKRVKIVNFQVEQVLRILVLKVLFCRFQLLIPGMFLYLNTRK